MREDSNGWQLSDDWDVSFDAFMSEYDDLFLRSETREKAILYVRGLLTDVQRKNSWQLAEAVGLPDPHPLQRLLNEAKWDADAVQARQRQRIMSQMSCAGYTPHPLEVEKHSRSGNLTKIRVMESAQHWAYSNCPINQRRKV